MKSYFSPSLLFLHYVPPSSLVPPKVNPPVSWFNLSVLSVVSVADLSVDTSERLFWGWEGGVEATGWSSLDPEVSGPKKEREK